MNRMMETFPEFKDNVEIQITEDSIDESEIEYKDLNRPVVLINNTIFSHGHVPIIKKLSRDIMSIIY